MMPENLEAQILLKDYTLAEAWEQENKWEDLFVDNSISTIENETDRTNTSQAYDEDFVFDMNFM